MLGFLQGFSYGLFMTCLPWLLVGLVNPGLAVPRSTPSRLQVIVRYCLVVPSLSMLLWLTSLWGGEANWPRFFISHKECDYRQAIDVLDLSSPILAA